MNQKTFHSVVGILFLIIAVLHALRLLYGWPAVIGTFVVPMWASWVAVVVAGTLSYHGLKKR